MFFYCTHINLLLCSCTLVFRERVFVSAKNYDICILLISVLYIYIYYIRTINEIIIWIFFSKCQAIPEHPIKENGTDDQKSDTPPNEDVEKERILDSK